MTPDVTFIVPVHGSSPWLSEALVSVQQQHGVRVECVVVLDRPAPPAEATAHRMADAATRVVASPRPGLAAALNVGLEAAEGRYVARLDADDIALPGRSATQAAFLDQNPHIAVLGSAAVLIDDQGREVGERIAPTSPVATRRRLRWRNALIHPSVMARTKLMLAVGGYDERIERGQDYELWLRVAQVSELCNLREPLVKYRLHGGQATRRARATDWSHRNVLESRLGLAQSEGRSLGAARLRHRAWWLRYQAQHVHRRKLDSAG